MITSPRGGFTASRSALAPPTGEAERVLGHPEAPLSLAESGLPLDLVLQLVLKTLHLSGDLVGTELGRRLGLRFPVIEPALAELRDARHVEVVSGSMLGPSSYEYRILDAGRTRAMLFLQQNQYVGVAPVPLAQYADYLRAHQAAVPRSATRERVRDACRHLVLSDRVIDSLGPAINAGHSLFVYGPPGNGKTVIAQSIRNLLDGDVAVPHAITVEGQIIRVFDPVVHEPIATPESDSLIVEGPAEDRRWVRCRRPLVTVGGELTLDSLELTYLPVSGFYRAPLQALANGGVLVIDDFGRQRVGPRDLLNRWIVPLESRVDYLDPADRPEVRAAVRHAGRLRHQHPAARSGRRGVPAAHPLQGVRREPVGRRLRENLGRRLRRARHRLRSRAGRARPDRVLPAAADPAARLPSARPHRPGAVARRISRRDHAPDVHSSRRGVRQLFRR